MLSEAGRLAASRISSQAAKEPSAAVRARPVGEQGSGPQLSAIKNVYPLGTLKRHEGRRPPNSSSEGTARTVSGGLSVIRTSPLLRCCVSKCGNTSRSIESRQRSARKTRQNRRDEGRFENEQFWVSRCVRAATRATWCFGRTVFS